MFKLSFIFLSLILLNSCAGPKPINDYVLAREALKFARSAGADSLASGWFHKAEDTYLKAELAWNVNENDLAKELFVRSRKYSERAENSARVNKFKSGAEPSD